LPAAHASAISFSGKTEGNCDGSKDRTGSGL
jgi:hypothetical protein